ncbi:hypothetical protein F444_13423, partial [Phytophthora nicotianae P1976]
MDGNDIANGSERDVAFASSDDEEVAPPTRRRVFEHAAAFNSLRAAKAGFDSFDSSMYKFSFNYGKKGHGQCVYKCVSHKDCGKRLRLRKDGDVEFKIQHAGQHGVDEVADMLLGRGPKKYRKILQERNAVPDATQPKNLKAHLKSSLANGWEIKNIVKIFWTYDAQTFCKNSRDFRHEFLVLECFEHAITTENGTKDSCFGLVVKSDKFSGTYSTLIMVNAAMASSVSRTEPTGSITVDGLWLVSGRMGLTTTEPSTAKHSHRGFTWYAQLFFGIDLQLAYGSLDRMAGIANAFAE